MNDYSQKLGKKLCNRFDGKPIEIKSIMNFKQYILYKDLFDQGNIFFIQKDYKNAIELFTNSLKHNPDYYLAYFQRGNAYYEIKEYPKALKDYSTALHICTTMEMPGTPIYKARGDLYFELGQYEKAFLDFQCVIEYKPYGDTFYRLGYICYLKKDIEKAKEFLKEAIRYGNNDAKEFISQL